MRTVDVKPTEAEFAIEISGLSKRFGGLAAVEDVSMAVSPGRIYGLIGPNGAGKTTVFNLITGIYRATEGHIAFFGKDITRITPHESAQLGIARTFQNIRLFGQLTVLQNVMVAGQMNTGYTLVEALTRTGRFRREERSVYTRAMELLNMVGLGERANDRACELPYGDQRRVEIARALAVDPRLMLLDEPAAGMNPEESARLADFIKEVKTRHRLTVVIIEHHMEVIMTMCDRITVLNFGRVIAEGTPDEVSRDGRVIEAYLGTKWGDARCW